MRGDQRSTGRDDPPSLVGPVVACLLLGTAFCVGLGLTANGAGQPRTALMAAMTAPPVCEGRAATIHPGDGSSPQAGDGWTVTGTPGDDVIVGTAGDDVIRGLGGDDVICGLGGDDVLTGDSGDDVLVSSGGRARLRGGPGADTLRAPRDSRSVLNGGPGRDLLEAGSTASLRAGPGRDTLTVWLSRGPLGVVVAGGGYDRVVVKAARGALPAGSTVTVDAYRSRLFVQGARGWASWRDLEEVHLDGPGVHWIYQGRDVLDRVTVRRGAASQLFGGEGADRLTGGPGDDVLHGGPGRDVLDGGAGRDRCFTGEVVRRCEVRR